MKTQCLARPVQHQIPAAPAEPQHARYRNEPRDPATDRAPRDACDAMTTDRLGAEDEQHAQCEIHHVHHDHRKKRRPCIARTTQGRIQRHHRPTERAGERENAEIFSCKYRGLRRHSHFFNQQAGTELQQQQGPEARSHSQPESLAHPAPRQQAIARTEGTRHQRHHAHRYRPLQDVEKPTDIAAQPHRIQQRDARLARVHAARHHDIGHADQKGHGIFQQRPDRQQRHLARQSQATQAARENGLVRRAITISHSELKTVVARSARRAPWPGRSASWNAASVCRDRDRPAAVRH